MAAATQPVEWTLNSVGQVLSAHIMKQEATDAQVAALYEMVVTGNGVPSLAETVRAHERWIEERRITLKEIDNERHKRSFEMRKGVILIVVTQVMSAVFVLVGLGVLNWLELLKK